MIIPVKKARLLTMGKISIDDFVLYLSSLCFTRKLQRQWIPDTTLTELIITNYPGVDLSTLEFNKYAKKLLKNTKIMVSSTGNLQIEININERYPKVFGRKIKVLFYYFVPPEATITHLQTKEQWDYAYTKTFNTRILLNITSNVQNNKCIKDEVMDSNRSNRSNNNINEQLDFSTPPPKMSRFVASSETAKLHAGSVWDASEVVNLSPDTNKNMGSADIQLMRYIDRLRIVTEDPINMSQLVHSNTNNHPLSPKHLCIISHRSQILTSCYTSALREIPTGKRWANIVRDVIEAYEKLGLKHTSM